MVTDWAKIRNDYINGGGSYRELSLKYGVSITSICKKSRAQGWVEQREKQLNETAKEVKRKTVEKISDAESEVAAIRARLRLKFMQEIEKRMGVEEKDGMEFRRLVQSYKDMCDITDGIVGIDDNEDGFLDALNGTAEEDWSNESGIPI